MSLESRPRIDVTPAEWQIVRDLLQKHIPHVEVWVFGSRATGKSKKFSDLDLALIGKEPIAREKIVELQEAFAESSLPYKVDLVDWAVTSPKFKKVIESQKIEIHL